MMKTYLVFYNLNKRNECHFSNPIPILILLHKQEVHRFFLFCFVFLPEATLQETENKAVMSEGRF